MPRVIHFEIPADNPDRAVKFYRDVFKWQINKWEGPMEYWLVSTGDKGQPGIDGAIMRRMPNGVTTNTVDVADLDGALESVLAAGGKILMGKSAVPGVGWMAYCADTEGNAFGLMQNDLKAK